MKKFFVILLVCMSLFAAANADFNVYPLAGKITEVAYDIDAVFFVDGAGHEWVFYGCEDWMVDDFVACLMWDAGTSVIFDDEILDVLYAGTFESCPGR